MKRQTRTVKTRKRQTTKSAYALQRRSGRIAPDSILNAVTQQLMRVQPPFRTVSGLLAAYGNTPLLKAVVDRHAWGVAMTPWTLSGVKIDDEYVPDLEMQYGLPAIREQRRTQLGEQIIPVPSTHPALRLLNDANPLMVGLSLKALTQIYLDVVGEAFWVKSRDALGVVRSVWPMPPHWVELPTKDRKTYMIRWRSVEIEAPASEVIRFYHPDPMNPYGRGLGTGGALTDEIDADEFASKHASAEFYNGAIPQLIITAEGLSEPDTERFEEKWLSDHQGFLKSHLPLFLNRKVDVEKLSQDFAALQLVDFRKFNRDTFQQTYGLPPELIGVLQNANRSTVSASDYINSRHNLVPRLELLRAVLQRHLIEEYDERLILDYVNPVNADNEFHLRAASFANWAPDVNEWRQMMGLPTDPRYAGIHYLPNRGTFGELAPTE